MANTWTVNANGTVNLNGTLLPNQYYAKFVVEWNTELGLLETYVSVSVPNTQEVNAITQLLSIVPGIPTLSQLKIYQPRTTYRSAQGDTINVSALSLVQQTTRPDKDV